MLKRRAASSLLGCRRSIAAMELAIVAPVLLFAAMSTLDVVLALLTNQTVYASAHMVAQAAGVLAVQTDQPALTPTQAQLAMTAVYGIIPGLKTTTTPYGVALSEVVFTQTTGANTRGAKLGWSTTLPSGLGTASMNGSLVKRACGAVYEANPSSTTATPSGYNTQVPTGLITNASTTIVADVSYQYRTIFPVTRFVQMFFPATLTFRATEMYPLALQDPLQTVTYDPGNTTNPDICP